MHYIAQSKQKLNLLALIGKGVPIDPETLATQFDIPNFGTIEGSTVIEKIFNWAKMQLENKANLAKLAKGLGLGDEEDGAKKPGPKPGQPGAGHPSSNKKNPQAKQKGVQSGGRVVMKTS